MAQGAVLSGIRVHLDVLDEPHPAVLVEDVRNTGTSGLAQHGHDEMPEWLASRTSVSPQRTLGVLEAQYVEVPSDLGPSRKFTIPAGEDDQ